MSNNTFTIDDIFKAFERWMKSSGQTNESIADYWHDFVIELTLRKDIEK